MWTCNPSPGSRRAAHAAGEHHLCAAGKCLQRQTQWLRLALDGLVLICMQPRRPTATGTGHQHPGVRPVHGLAASWNALPARTWSRQHWAQAGCGWGWWGGGRVLAAAFVSAAASSGPATFVPGRGGQWPAGMVKPASWLTRSRAMSCRICLLIRRSASVMGLGILRCCSSCTCSTHAGWATCLPPPAHARGAQGAGEGSSWAARCSPNADGCTAAQLLVVGHATAATAVRTSADGPASQKGRSLRRSMPRAPSSCEAAAGASARKASPSTGACLSVQLRPELPGLVCCALLGLGLALAFLLQGTSPVGLHTGGRREPISRQARLTEGRSSGTCAREVCWAQAAPRAAGMRPARLKPCPWACCPQRPTGSQATLPQLRVGAGHCVPTSAARASACASLRAVSERSECSFCCLEASWRSSSWRSRRCCSAALALRCSSSLSSCSFCFLRPTHAGVRPGQAPCTPPLWERATSTLKRLASEGRHPQAATATARWWQPAVCWQVRRPWQACMQACDGHACRATGARHSFAWAGPAAGGGWGGGALDVGLDQGGVDPAFGLRPRLGLLRLPRLHLPHLGQLRLPDLRAMPRVSLP